MGMRVGIIKTGTPPAPLATSFSSYPEMIATLLGPAFEFKEYDAQAGVLPNQDEECEGFVLTGSAASAYESVSWITSLKKWLQGVSPAVPLIGICFGHQIMAQSFGGTVGRAANGWGLGKQEYQVEARPAWMDRVDRFVLAASHYDQVLAVPPAAQIVAGNDFCPIGALAYENRRAISFQAHPEFDIDYITALIELRRNLGVIDPAFAAQCLESLRLADDRIRVGHWMASFLKQRAA